MVNTKASERLARFATLKQSVENIQNASLAIALVAQKDAKNKPCDNLKIHYNKAMKKEINTAQVESDSTGRRWVAWVVGNEENQVRGFNEHDAINKLVDQHDWLEL